MMPKESLTDSATREISLRLARERARMSLRAAARKIGVTHVYLSALEHGRKALPPSRRAALHALYNLAEDEVLIQPQIQKGVDFVQWLHEQASVWDSRFILPTVPSVRRRTSDLFVEPLFLSEAGILSQSELLENFFSDSDNRALLLAGKIGTG